MSAITSRTNLQAANDIRSTRAQMRRHIHALPRSEGRLAVAALLLTTPDWLHSQEIAGLLAWPARTYQEHVDEWLAAAKASSVARVAGPYRRDNSHQSPLVLSARQREVLADCLRRSL